MYDYLFGEEKSKRKVKLDCGGRYIEGNSKEDILEFIKDHFKLLAKKNWQTEYSLVRYLEKNYFNNEFNPTQAEAKKLLEEDNFLYHTMLGCTALDLFHWYAKYGNKEKEATNLFNMGV